MRKTTGRMLITLLLLGILLPTTAYAMAPPEPPAPAHTSGTLVSLPFPVSDAPVEASSSELTFSWGRRQYGRLNFPIYRGTLTAEYTLRFTGEEPGYVEVALPVHFPDGFSHTFDQGVPEDFSATLDGEPIEFLQNFATSRELFWNTSLAELIEEVRELSGPYYPTVFDADRIALLYSFEVEMPEHLPAEIGRIRHRFAYNRDVTTLIVRTPRLVTVIDDSNWWEDDGPGVIRFSISPPDQELVDAGITEAEPMVFDILVLGEDTLELDEFTPLVYAGRDERNNRTFAHLENSGIALNQQVSEVTPREFFRKLQNESTYPQVVHPQDFLLRRNTQELHDGSSFINVRTYVITNQNIIVATIPFQPGEERVLSITMPVRAAMSFDRELSQSLFSHTIHTEAAGLWESFGPLVVTTTHPEGVITYELPEGFESAGASSLLRAERPGENITFGFWLIDNEREDPPSSGLGGALLFIFVVFIVLPAGAIILVIVIIVIAIVRVIKRKNAQS